MIPRNLELPIHKYKSQYPVIAIVGPRQSGKTTLAQNLFHDYDYCSLENLDMRLYAEEDPRGFLKSYPPPLIIDEAQRAPSLFAYLQEMVDKNSKPAQYVLTGSQQFLLMEKITQSLAGRIIIFTLFPFTVNELIVKRFDKDIHSIFTVKKENKKHCNTIPIDSMIFSGMFPRIHDKHLDASKWLENYTVTYIERDIRNLINIENLHQFEIFIKTVASYSGQLVNYASLSNRIGISQPTVKKWLSMLETSGVIFFLQPYFKNVAKRVIKTPKLYFIDTGLLCFLLSIRSQKELIGHPLYGSIFETFIIAELYKRIVHTGITTPPLYFFRDRTGNEIDCIVEWEGLLTVEIKSAKTYNPKFTEGIQKCNPMLNAQKGIVIYGGDHIFNQDEAMAVVPWWAL